MSIFKSNAIRMPFLGERKSSESGEYTASFLQGGREPSRNGVVQDNLAETVMKNFRKNPVMLYNHYDIVGRFTGVSIEETTNKQVRISTSFIFANTNLGREVEEMWKGRVLNSFSTQMYYKEGSEYDYKTNIRKTRGVAELFEISVVDIPGFPRGTAENAGKLQRNVSSNIHDAINEGDYVTEMSTVDTASEYTQAEMMEQISKQADAVVTERIKDIKASALERRAEGGIGKKSVNTHAKGSQKKQYANLKNEILRLALKKASAKIKKL